MKHRFLYAIIFLHAANTFSMHITPLFTPYHKTKSRIQAAPQTNEEILRDTYLLSTLQNQLEKLTADMTSITPSRIKLIEDHTDQLADVHHAAYRKLKLMEKQFAVLPTEIQIEEKDDGIKHITFSLDELSQEMLMAITEEKERMQETIQENVHDMAQTYVENAINQKVFEHNEAFYYKKIRPFEESVQRTTKFFEERLDALCKHTNLCESNINELCTRYKNTRKNSAGFKEITTKQQKQLTEQAKIIDILMRKVQLLEKKNDFQKTLRTRSKTMKRALSN